MTKLLKTSRILSVLNEVVIDVCEIHKTHINHENGEDFISVCSDEMKWRNKVYKLSCFEKARNKYIKDKYMPLFFWNDDTKQYYKDSEGIIYSDCYEVWGMDRTGCTGCPFNSKANRDLKIIRQYEPGLYKACLNVFGESYELMDKFGIRRHKILDEDMIIDLEEVRKHKKKNDN